MDATLVVGKKSECKILVGKFYGKRLLGDIDVSVMIKQN
jgi:hypothetical protein